MNSKLLQERKLEPFSVKKIWDDLIIDKKITGVLFEDTFYHTTDLNIYNKLKKKYYFLTINSLHVLYLNIYNFLIADLFQIECV